MPPLGTAAFARRFRALSASERRRFLAALWTARGYDTRVDDGVVVAEADAETVRIDVAGRLSRADSDADVVVGLGDADRLRDRARDAGAEFLAPADLHHLLLYGIDRETGEPIAREHLGTSLSLPPREPPDRRVPAGAALATVLVIVLAVAALSGVGLPVPDGSTAADAEPPTTEAAPAPTATETAALPAGVSESGVTEPDEAITAHWRRVDGRSRRLAITYSGPANSSVFRDVVRHESEGALYRQDRFHVSTVDYVVREENGSQPETVTRTEFDSFATPEEVFTRYHDGNETSYSTAPLSRRTTWNAMEGFAVQRYAEALRANDTTVDRVEGENRTLIRIEARGAAEGAAVDATGYAATIYLTTDGRLVRLAVTYTHEPTGETVRLSVTYTDLNEVAPPEPPDWIDEARD